MRTKTITTLITVALLLFSCGGGNRQQTTSENKTTTVETVEIVPTDPAIIDIAGNLENRKEFRLSDFGSSVQYIRLQPPEGMEFGGVSSVFSNDEFLFVNAPGGLFLYSADGKYLRTLVLNEWEEMPNAPGGGVGLRQVDGILNNVDFLSGILFYRTFQRTSRGITGVQLNIIDTENLSENPHLQPSFQQELDPDRDSRGTRFLIDNYSFLAVTNNAVGVPTITAKSIKNGDTLFAINNYYQPTITGGIMTMSTSTFYRFNGNLMMQKAHNDTVFALIPPNRIAPAFIMQWGEFKPDMNRLANGGTEEGKFVLQNWVETQHHIFIEYTEGRAFPSRWAEGNVRHHWAIFDKETKTLTHHLTSPIPAKRDVPAMMSRMPIPLMFENDIDPVGMPFFPRGVNHRGEMYMVFSKEQVQQQIATGKFNNSRLQALYNRMPDGSFYLMIVR